jgi:hypothetical protein
MQLGFTFVVTDGDHLPPRRFREWNEPRYPFWFGGDLTATMFNRNSFADESIVPQRKPALSGEAMI